MFNNMRKIFLITYTLKTYQEFVVEIVRGWCIAAHIDMIERLHNVFFKFYGDLRRNNHEIFTKLIQND